MTGPLKKSLRCWLKCSPYDLQEGVPIISEWDERLQWWRVSFIVGGEIVKAITTDQPVI